MPPRSQAWTDAFASVLPSPSLGDAILLSSIPNLKEAVVISSPLILEKNPSPKINPKERKKWTAKERVRANNAKEATTADDLKRLVFIFPLYVFSFLFTVYTTLFQDGKCL